MGGGANLPPTDTFAHIGRTVQPIFMRFTCSAQIVSIFSLYYQCLDSCSCDSLWTTAQPSSHVTSLKPHDNSSVPKTKYLIWLLDYLIWKWRSVNRKYNNLLNRNDHDAIATALTFSTMPDFDMALPTWPDIGESIKVAGINPEVEIAFEKKTMTMRFQRLHPHLRQCST